MMHEPFMPVMLPGEVKDQPRVSIFPVKCIKI